MVMKLMVLEMHQRPIFQKEPGQLQVEEAAVLVGLLKGSTRYNPRRNPKAAMARRNTVLDQMVRNDYLTEEEAKALKIQPIALNYLKLDENSGIAPYFREVLRDEIKNWCKENENPKTGETLRYIQRRIENIYNHQSKNARIC